MKTIRFLLPVLLFLLSGTVCAEVSLDPRPDKVVEKSGVFNLKKKTYIFADDSEGAKPAARALRDHCKRQLNKKLVDPHSLPDKGNRIAFYGDDRLSEGGYAIRMYKDLIEVRAASPAGFHSAVHILEQLIRTRQVPLVNVDGQP